MNKDIFTSRHNGINKKDEQEMLKVIGLSSLEELINQTVPENIKFPGQIDLEEGISEYEYLKNIRKIGQKNKQYKSYIGLGYYNTILPAVIQRNILENPSWYTSYTPYQAEISQGRLEALLNFQTAISELTGMPLANASLLDEATSAAEAMIMMFNCRSRAAVKKGANVLLADENIFPHTLDVLQTRATPLGIVIKTVSYKDFILDETVFGAIVQYPNAEGIICDYTELTKKLHENGSMLTVIADIMSLAIITPPGEWGADVVVGSTQRLGIPMGYGGPHAAYFATNEKYKRNIPGRIIGVSTDADGKYALRMALQTREQHIKRERATSNICTAQALLASMAGMYVVYHGAEGIKRIANNIHKGASILSNELRKLGYGTVEKNFFDTINVKLPKGVNAEVIRKNALSKKINLLYIDRQNISISIDETTTLKDINRLIKIFAYAGGMKVKKTSQLPNNKLIDNKFIRKSTFLTLEVFKRYRTETELMRYIKKLERKDISLTHSMIPLGSCTMKLNAAVELLHLSCPEFGNIHPFVPKDQAKGYRKLFSELEKDLKVITGFDAISFQPNSGAAGEYTGLMVIRKYFEQQGQGHRNIALIPASAHGTNPASAVMAGMKTVTIKCDEKGNVDYGDLKEKAEENAENLAVFIITYPSTHGIFETEIVEMCELIHKNGGQVYMDGANMNAQVAVTSPGYIGADVCHLNLHKTFAIPHGGGGPGVGPIGVASHLKEFLPSHTVIKTGGKNGMSAVAAAPYGSASILPISYGYIKMLGGEGLKKATYTAILNANYLAEKLKDHYPVLYKGANGRVGHEMIIDCRIFKEEDIEVTDIAKRLMDYGFHAPTVSFPVGGTLMVEPTESESIFELNRFIEAMISIRNEIREIKEGKADKKDNVLKNAPHTVNQITASEWKHSYSREKAVFPLAWVKDNKFFPSVARVNDAYGDRNLCCTSELINKHTEEVLKIEV